jgi:RimJ/RimL family protein N-acetyltransferase
VSSRAFDAQPILQGERPSPPAADRGLGGALRVASDSLVWEQHPARDRHELEVFRAFFDEALASGGALVVVDRANGLVIGSSRFHGYDEAKSEVEIGWTFLARLYWGGVYNGEMKRLMLEHAFRFVDSVIFVIGPKNLRSQKAVLKLGAVRTDETAGLRRRQPGVPAHEGGVRERHGVRVSIFSDDTWTVGTADQDGQPIIIRVRGQMPDAPARHGHAQLIVVGWPYDGTATGLPGAEDNGAMQAFEDAIEAGLERTGAGVQVARGAHERAGG